MNSKVDQENVCNLLNYAEEILKAGERVVSDLTRDAVMVFHQKDVRGLEGVTIPNDEGGWLRVARLREVPPPSPDDAYLPWLSIKAGLGAMDRPTLVDALLVPASIEGASDLVEACLAATDDIMKPKGARADAAGTVDILLRISNLREFQAAFETWVANVWTAWADVERPRRRGIAFYNRLFEVQQRAASMGDDVPMEVILGIGMARWTHPAGKINAPLIEASVELELNPEDSSLTVRSRDQAPRLALRAFDHLDIEGMGRLNREASIQLDRLHGDPDVSFSPHEPASFEPILRMCHARIAADAIYEPDIQDEKCAGAPERKLHISNDWVLYVRQRSSNFRCDDIRRLVAAVKAVEHDGALPAPALRMTTRPADAPIEEQMIDLSDTIIRLPDTARHFESQPPSANGEFKAKQPDERAYFFPLPFNDEQIEVVQRLERSDACGVVVQGPPGTGKTHTIANIIAHYMATGRRVLVSAHEPEALSAIQYKLPESIRDLAISVIHSDRDGARKLEHAIDILANQVKQIDVREYNERRLRLERSLLETRLALTETDERIQEHARQNLRVVDFRGRRLMPMELSAAIEAERHQHEWFADKITMEADFDPRFGDADIAEARRIRAELGRDILYRSEVIPDASVLPDVPRILAAHAALARDRHAMDRVASGELPYISFGRNVGMDEARALHEWLNNLEQWRDEVARSEPWLADLYRLLVGGHPSPDAMRHGIRALCDEWATLYLQGSSIAFQGVELPDVAMQDAAFDTAIEALADGKKPFGVFSFGKSGLKAQIDGVRVDGAVADGPAAWSRVRACRAWQRKAQLFAGKWSAVARALGYPGLSGDWGKVSAELIRLGSLVERMQGFHTAAERKIAMIAVLFPDGIDARRVVLQCELTTVREALSESLESAGRTEAREIRRRLNDISALADTPFHVALREIAGLLGDSGLSSRALAEGWRQLLNEATRLDALRASRRRLEEIAAAVASSGAPKWARVLLSTPAKVHDPLTPTAWKSTWEWARADGFLRGLSDRGGIAAIAARRLALEEKQRETLGELVRVRTFIGLKQGITERIASALTKFAMKVRQLGAGTGKAAERHRRAIREATLEAASAVPCWILPEWRVAEQLPSELAAFDLVIIDEASQSDITALPVVMRGKKLLVVGDDKQVSPSAVGMEEKAVIQLRETFLRGMDIANYLEPTTSLYDLASMTFPGTVIMLREHFRCVEPIINFSKRFYPKALVPLRLPTALERLDPPLIDVFIPNGRKARDVNEAEASYIIEEIARLVEDPKFRDRTIGVISLIGDKQAKFIHGRLVETVGPDVFARHRIGCGNASTFQGQERDIIFLSMVACPATSRAQTARLMEQRFNVALSRARDRMYLVRSVTASSLSAKDLKAAVIEHFRNPMADAVIPRSDDSLEACDSDFERDVGGCLLRLGYRVRPQVPVGGYRIDFVVEGAGSERLALELDGDRYHGPEKWAEDQHRQRALERMGWVFWRCWGSHWLSDRQGCLDDLVKTLTSRGIRPIGGEFSPQIWTEHRVIGAPVDLVVAESNELGAAARDVAAETGHPVLAASNGIPDTGSKESVSVIPAGRETLVEVGDTVIVRFADDNRVRRFKLSSEANDPDLGVIHIGQPIGVALLGNALEEEVDLVVGGRERRIIIEKITKAA